MPPEVIIEPPETEPAGRDAEEEEAPPDPDIEKNKAMAVLAYICFVIPLLGAPNSPYARFHTNQGIISCILWAVAVIGCIVLQIAKWVVGFVFASVPILKGFFGCLLYPLQAFLLVGAVTMMVYGIIQAATGEKKGLPLVGTWTIIKPEAPTASTPESKP